MCVFSYRYVNAALLCKLYMYENKKKALYKHYEFTQDGIQWLHLEVSYKCVLCICAKLPTRLLWKYSATSSMI